MTSQGLSVSLVTGLAGAGKTMVAEAICGRAAGARTEHSLYQPVIVSAEFPRELAETLCEIGDAGHRGHVVVELPPLVDATETGLILECMLAERGEDEPAVWVRDLITVARVADIRQLLFQDGVVAAATIEDYDSGERLVRQLEIATVVVLAGGEMIRSALLRQVEAFLAKINPAALVIPLVAAAGLASSRAHRRGRRGLGERMGWTLELAGEAGPPTTVESMGTFVFRDPRMFHPGRLAEVINGCLEPARVGRIVRSRGLVRLASRPGRVGSWSSAGPVLSLDPTDMYSWDPDSPLGQELVFVGQHLRPQKIANALCACLLSDDEFIAGPMQWATYSDPFPAWDVVHGH